MHKLQSVVPVIATVKSCALLMACVGESVSTNMRKGDGQRELQEEAGKSKKRSIALYIGVARIFDWGAQTTNHMQ